MTLESPNQTYSYNKELFDNMKSSIYLIIEVHPQTKTIKILENKILQIPRELFDDSYETFLKITSHEVAREDKEAYLDYMNLERISKLKSEEVKKLFFRYRNSQALLQIVLTPVVDKDNQTTCIYGSVTNVHISDTYKRYIRVLEGIGAIYENIFDINLKTNTFTAIKIEEELKNRIDMNQSFEKNFDAFLYIDVLPQYREKLKAFANFASLENRFAGHNELSIEYESYLQGWIRDSIIVVDRDKDNHLMRILYVSNHINAQKKAQLELENNIETIHDALLTISSLYQFVIQIDVDNDMFVALRDYTNENEINTPIVYSEFIRTKSSNYIDQHHMQRFLEFYDATTFDQRLKDTNSISIEYLTTHNTWTFATLIAQERTYEGHIKKAFIVGYDTTEKVHEIDTLTKMSNTDVLTGLENRRSYEQDISKLASVPQDQYLMIIDINGLKPINDTQGHHAGDQVIIGIANAISDAVGGYGKTYRVGGDEFLVRANCDEKTMNQILSLMDMNLKSYHDVYHNELSISRGIVHQTEVTEKTFTQLEKEADRRMYSEKQNYYRNLNGLLDDINQQVSICDAETYELLYANKEALKLFPGPQENYTGWTCHKYFTGQDEPCSYCPIKQMKEGESSHTCEIHNGDYVFNVCVKKIIWQGRKAYAEFVQDLTEIRKQQHNYEVSFKLLLESVPNAKGIYLINLDEANISALKSTHDSTQFDSIGTLESFYENNLKAKMNEKDYQEFIYTFGVDSIISMYQNGINSLSKTMRVLIDDHKLWYQYTVKIIKNPTSHILYGVLFESDINEEHEKKIRTEQLLLEAERKIKEEQERNARMQYIDHQTGCLNLYGFTENIKKVLTLNPDSYYGIVFIDFKNLAYINNTRGMDYGNKVIVEFAKHANELISLREEQYVCHITGGTFAFFIKYGLIQNTNDDSITDILTSQYKEISKAFFHNFSLDIQLQGYVGIFFISPMEIFKTPVELMVENASLAMKRAKKDNNSNFIIFNIDEWENQKRQIMISNLFDKAIENQEFDLCYQPQFNNLTNQIIGVEALCRWKSQELGDITPGEFIPILETNNQITKLDVYVWELVCKQLYKWKQEGKNIIPISVNVSRIDLKHVDIQSILVSLIEKYQLEKWMLKIEITETACMEDTKKAIETIKALKRSGFMVEMDDFGSGYSSLNMLKKLPVDVVKLDMQFMEYQEEEDSSEIIIESIIKMTNRLSMTIITEGVETKEQNELLKRLGCHLIQGYFYSQPVPIKELEKLIESYNQ